MNSAISQSYFYLIMKCNLSLVGTSSLRMLICEFLIQWIGEASGLWRELLEVSSFTHAVPTPHSPRTAPLCAAEVMCCGNVWLQAAAEGACTPTPSVPHLPEALTTETWVSCHR